MNKSNNTFLITGAAGFIGAALVKKLLKSGESVIGIDNINDYYDQGLKKDRLKNIELSIIQESKWRFEEVSIEDQKALEEVFEKYKPNIVVNLAAQAGVRYSIVNPHAYIKSNILGFHNVLDNCRKFEVDNLVYASSSSVYGGNKVVPFQEDQNVSKPLSIYAATKYSNELMAHAYSNIYSLPTIGLRFFTVYGPWGRPDMAPMIFVKSILNREPIEVYNFGKMKRDFTYIDDVIEGIYRCCYKAPSVQDSFDEDNTCISSSLIPYRVFNLGNSSSIELINFIEILENEIGIKAIKIFKSMQKGDVVVTSANMDKLKNWVGFAPNTKIEDGIEHFVKWYKIYYQV